MTSYYNPNTRRPMPPSGSGSGKTRGTTQPFTRPPGFNPRIPGGQMDPMNPYPQVNPAYNYDPNHAPRPFERMDLSPFIGPANTNYGPSSNPNQPPPERTFGTPGQNPQTSPNKPGGK